MAGLVPAIYVFLGGAGCKKDMDARDKRGHDERNGDSTILERLWASERGTAWDRFRLRSAAASLSPVMVLRPSVLHSGYGLRTTAAPAYFFP
jgi:hypothetical protein